MSWLHLGIVVCFFRGSDGDPCQGWGAGRGLEPCHCDSNGRHPGFRVGSCLGYQDQTLASVGKRTWVFLVLSGVATGLSWICYFRALAVR